MGNGDKSDEGNGMQDAFEEEIKKPYYGVFYLDNFKLPYRKLDVSAIIPTYNRCPYKPNSLKAELNPLSWAIESLLLQKPKISEIIVVDDKSEDYTERVVESFQLMAKKEGVKLQYIKNKERLGNSLARDVGCRAANSKYLLFMDDDCIAPPYGVFGGVYTFEKIEEKGIKIGMVNLPTYFRSSMPHQYCSKKEIGTLSFLRGSYTTNKDCFPVEYIESEGNEKFLDFEYHILNPFMISNMNSGFTICSKKCYQEVGGFKKSVIKRGIDREFGCEAIENGYSIYFQPDPKFNAPHGAYGLVSDRSFSEKDWFRKVGGGISLKKAMSVCNTDNRQKTGMRISPNEYFYHAILSFFVLVYPRNKKGAIKWIRKVYDGFVKEGVSEIFGGIQIPVPSEAERKEMWSKAIKTGMDFIREREKKDIKKISDIIEMIDNEGQISEDVIKLISETK